MFYEKVTTEPAPIHQINNPSHICNNRNGHHTTRARQPQLAPILCNNPTHPPGNLATIHHNSHPYYARSYHIRRHIYSQLAPILCDNPTSPPILCKNPSYPPTRSITITTHIMRHTKPTYITITTHIMRHTKPTAVPAQAPINGSPRQGRTGRRPGSESYHTIVPKYTHIYPAPNPHSTPSSPCYRTLLIANSHVDLWHTISKHGKPHQTPR